MVQQRKQSLPLSSQEAAAVTKGPGIRRRLSSLSLNLKIQNASNNTKTSSSIREWWGWGWAWILSRKPTFASDLEMNEEETAALGTHSRGSWRHLFYKLISHIRRKLLRPDNVGLPQTFRYHTNASSYSFIQ